MWRNNLKIGELYGTGRNKVKIGELLRNGPQ